MQHEVAEVAEPGGGSSAMPHKRNPAASAIALAAANRTPGLVAAFLAGMVQEHERVRRRLACRVADGRSYRPGDRIGSGGARRRCD